MSPRFFRPPFGVTNPRYASVLTALNMKSVGWSLRSYDTVIRQPETLLAFVLKNLKPRSIVLFHDNQNVTALVLDEFLERCEKMNFAIADPWTQIRD